MYRGSIDPEEDQLHIQGFTNFTAATFVAKCFTANSSKKSHLCWLQLGQLLGGHYPRFMIICVDQNKDPFKNRQLCGVENFRFVTTER